MLNYYYLDQNLEKLISEKDQKQARDIISFNSKSIGIPVFIQLSVGYYLFGKKPSLFMNLLPLQSLIFFGYFYYQSNLARELAGYINPSIKEAKYSQIFY